MRDIIVYNEIRKQALLKAGDYDGLNGREKADKIKADYEAFLIKRAKLISKAVEKLTAGEEVYAIDILNT